MAYTDLRKGRFSQAGQIYHVTTVTLGRRAVFADWVRGRKVVAALQSVANEGKADTLCFVVMPDHLHWLLSLQQGTLSEVVRLVKGRSARACDGRLWQPNYHDHALRKEEDLQATARYIVANPLRAGLVRRLGDYPLWDAVWL